MINLKTMSVNLGPAGI